MKLAAFIDPLMQLNQAKDTTLHILARAKKFKFDCYIFTQDQLFCTDGKVFAFCDAITFNTKQEITILNSAMHALESFDIVLIRKDPPFNMEYIYATYLLELVAKTQVLVVNNPRSIRDNNEKLSILNFPSFCVPTLISKNIDKLTEFWQLHQDVVFKPLNMMGGKEIFHVDHTQNNLAVILEILTKNQTRTIMAQKYIFELTQVGDKRILVIDGEPIPYALARMPYKSKERGNIAAGGIGKVVPLNTEDKAICKQLAPFLKEQGLSFVGLDIIGNYLTEINCTSPTCMVEIAKVTKLDIAGCFLEMLQRKLKSN